MRVRHVISTLMVLFLVASGFAQSTGGTDLSTNVRIEGTFIPKVADATRKTDLPETIDTVPQPPELRYDFLAKQFKTKLSIDTIKAAKIKGLPLSDLDRVHARLAFGSFTTTLADVHYNSLRSRKQALGVRFKHFGGRGDIDDRFAGYSDNSLRLYGRKFLKTHRLNAEVQADRNALHYYGYDQEAFPNYTKDSTRQTFLRAGGKFSVQSFLKDSTDLNHQFEAAYYHLRDDFSASENNVKINGRVHKYFDIEDLFVETSVDFNNYQDTFGTSNTTIVGLGVGSDWKGKDWNLTFGILANLDQQPGNSTFHFYPNVYFSYNLVSEVLIPYAGVRGGVARNSLSTISRENPFVNTQNLQLNNSNTKSDLFIGLRGAFSSKSSFNLQAARMRVEDFVLFANDTTVAAANRFLTLYDTANVVRLRAEGHYRQSEKLLVLLKGEYFVYDTEVEFEAWHRPDWVVSLSGKYNMQEKIILQLEGFLRSGQLVKSYDPESEESYGNGIYGNRIKGVADFNLGVEYRYTDKISAFLQLSNIFAARYQRWNNFPSQGFTAFGGVTFSLWSE